MGENSYLKKQDLFSVFQCLADLIGLFLFGRLVEKLMVSTFALARTNTDSPIERNHTKPWGWGWGCTDRKKLKM